MNLNEGYEDFSKNRLSGFSFHKRLQKSRIIIKLIITPRDDRNKNMKTYSDSS